MKTVWIQEQTALSTSVVLAAVCAVAGIGWGLWTGSITILFDGAYSLLSLLLSLLALYAARLVSRPPCRRFPFGHGALEPLVIAVKGVAIALLCLLSFAAALHAMFTGGRAVQADLAMLFAAISAAVCLLAWWYLRAVSRRHPSGLIAAEHRQWLMDTVLSVAVLIGFAIAWGLERTAWSPLALYADPLMVMLASGYFLTVPIKMMRGALRELTLAAAPATVEHSVQATLRSAGIDQEHVRMAKLGPYLLLQVEPHATPAAGLRQLQARLQRQLAELALRPVVLIRATASL